MRKRVIAAALAAMMAVTGLAGCGGSGTGKEEAKKNIEVPTEPFGDAIKYDPSVEINGGKDIAVELWEWGWRCD